MNQWVGLPEIKDMKFIILYYILLKAVLLITMVESNSSIDQALHILKDCEQHDIITEFNKRTQEE